MPTDGAGICAHAGVSGTGADPATGMTAIAPGDALRRPDDGNGHAMSNAAPGPRWRRRRRADARRTPPGRLAIGRTGEASHRLAAVVILAMAALAGRDIEPFPVVEDRQARDTPRAAR